MTFLIDLDEGTAARRRVPFRLFTSDGTSPDTGASNDTMFLLVNGAAQIVSAGSVSAISAAAGMYFNELSVSNVSVLGSIALYHDDGDFPQHVATIQVVNFNPMSTLSSLSDVTVHSGGISSTAFAAGAVDAASFAADAGAELGDAFLNRDLSLGADSGSSGVRTPRDCLRALRNRVDLSGNTLTVFEEDDITVAWTASLTTTANLDFPTGINPNG